jgi:hypothetical protein
MRKLFVVVVLVAVAVSLHAQSEAGSVYVRTAPIIKIYIHQLGYRVYYLTERGDTASFHVPIDWFNETAGRAAITFGVGPQYPYFSAYWVDKKFSHIKLFLIENMQSDTWGVLKGEQSQLAEQFKVEELKLK